MTYRIRLPAGSARPYLDLIEPNSSSVLRFIRRNGLAEYEPSTAAAVLAAAELSGPDLAMFDIGSNIGLYSLLVASVLQPQKVVSFEPAPATAETARRIARRNGLPIDVVEAAAGERPGRAALHFSPISDESNSLREGFRQATGTVDVDVVTVDGYAESTGLAPSVMKIDVETFEQEVLRGARQTIEAHRPVIIVEVLKRKGHDHGIEITEEMSGLGYHYYALPAEPTWEPSASIHGLGTTDRDWLLLPEQITPEFVDTWNKWRESLGAITVDRNPRVPIWLSAQAAFRRGGVREVFEAAIRFARSTVRRRSAG